MKQIKVIIIGGGIAGSNLALHLRKLNKDIDITILEQTSHYPYSKCALPYVNKIKKDITIFPQVMFKDNNIEFRTKAKVTSIDTKQKKVYVVEAGMETILDYDKLVLASGAECRIPNIKGIKSAQFSCFKSSEDAKLLKLKGKTIAIIGAGYIGVELAAALKDNKVILLESFTNILPTVLDPDMSIIVREHLEELGVEIHTNFTINKIANNKINDKIKYDHLILATGVKPNLNLALTAKIKTDKGIITNDLMQTSDKDVYAVGDCVQCTNMFGQPAMSQLATTALKQSKVAAENIAGKKTKMLPVLNTSISKVGDLIVASTGMLESQKSKYAQPISAISRSMTKAAYHPEASPLTVKIVTDSNKIIIGCQIIGKEDVVGRINMAALAIQNKMSLDKLINCEAAFNPCVSPIFDPLILAAEICQMKWGAKHGNR